MVFGESHLFFLTRGLCSQVREKTDKFQQRRLDGFFKAGMKACNEACATEEPEPEPEMPEVMAMEVEMEVCKDYMFEIDSALVLQTLFVLGHHRKNRTCKANVLVLLSFGPGLLIGDISFVQKEP